MSKTTGPDPALAYIGLGANLGDPEGQIQGFIDLLKADERVTDLHVSHLRWTQPVGLTDQPKFLNGACCFLWSDDVWDLFDFLRDQEKAAGRQSKGNGGPRTLDLDMLMFNDYEMESDALTLPHPRMLARSFVLDPLADLGWYPSTGKI